ncbi:hypothetical protein RBB50_002929 [Rhinocladiella similis]
MSANKQPSTEEPEMSLYERTQKAKQDLHKRNMEEHLAVATTYLWQVQMAETNGGEQPEPLEGTYFSAVDMLKFDMEHGGKTLRELYHKNVLKKKNDSRKTNKSEGKSKVSKEQARKEYLAQLKLEAEARLDARLSKNTIQEIGRNPDRHSSSGDNALLRKRKLSDESLESSDSTKRQKRTGSMQPITNKRMRDSEDDEGGAKRKKSSTPEKDAAPKDTQVIGGKTNTIDKRLPPTEATALTNKRKRVHDEVDNSGNEELASNNVPEAKRVRSDHNEQSKAVKTPVAKQSATPPATLPAAEPLVTGVPKNPTNLAAVAKPGPSNTSLNNTTPKVKVTDMIASDQDGYKVGNNIVWKGGNQLRDKYKKKPLPPMMTKIINVSKVTKPVFKPKKLLRLGDPSPSPSP